MGFRRDITLLSLKSLNGGGAGPVGTLATEEDIENLANEFMGGYDYHGRNRAATDEEVEEMIGNLDTL